METKDLQNEKISDIIRACAKSGVSQLKFGDLEITFSTITKAEGTQLTHAGTHTPPEQLGKVDSQEKTPDEEMDDIQKRALEELHASQQLIDNPLAHEEAILEEFAHDGEKYEGNEVRRIKPAL